MVGSSLVNTVSVHWNSHLRIEFSPEAGHSYMVAKGDKTK